MTRVTLLIGLLFYALSCNSQTPKKKPATTKAQPSTKNLKLEFLTFNQGDLAHYTFKDLKTGEEIGVEFDDNDAGYRVAKEEIDKYCDGNGNGKCKMSGQKYAAVLQYKLVDIYDWNGEEAVKTGKKEKRWILTNLSKISVNISTPKLTSQFIFKSLYPNSSNYDKDNFLVRNAVRFEDNSKVQLHSEVKTIYQYAVGPKKMAFVVIYSYVHFEGQEDPMGCHACFPEMEFGYFEFKNEKWIKIKHIDKWMKGEGSWSMGPELSIKNIKGKNLMILKSSYMQHGETSTAINHYEIETLKRTYHKITN